MDVSSTVELDTSDLVEMGGLNSTEEMRRLARMPEPLLSNSFDIITLDL